MTDLLYRWPSAARFGRRVPKEKFYAHGKVTTAVREKLVSEVQRITWEYKLAESTINLPGSKDVPEIQVFRIDTKAEDVSDKVLATIDKSIPFPIVFEVTRPLPAGRQVRMVAAHKQLGMGAPNVSQYFSTRWQPSDIDRRPLPTAITLPALYTALLEPLTGMPVRSGEEMSEVAARLKIVRRLERDITRLERRLKNEKQFNRRIELRRMLRAKQAEVEEQG